MLEPNNTSPIRTNSPEEPKQERHPSVGDYTILLENQTPRPPNTQAPLDTECRRPSLTMRIRNAADALTHPSRNFHLPRLATRNAAHAEELLAVYCGRLADWGLATFEPTTPEAHLLHELSTLNVLLQSSAQSRAADPSAFETEAHASAVLSLTREVMTAQDQVTGFRLGLDAARPLSQHMIVAHPSAAMIWFLRRRCSVSGLSRVEGLMWERDGGESGFGSFSWSLLELRRKVFNFRMLSLLELWSPLLSGSLFLTFGTRSERLRTDKHVGTLSIFGRGETGREWVRSPDLHFDRLLSSICLIFLTFCVLL
jgi:hypothetical protein